MQLPFEYLLKLILSEAFARRNAMFILFAIISLSFLAVGSVWPKKFTAFSIILADESNILQPLMEGTAEATRTTDYVGNAREIIFGEKIMVQILENAGWLDDEPSEIEKEQYKKNIKENVKINGIGKNLIKIEYRDSSPVRSYITAKRFAELFIEEGEKSKINESQAAFNFIEKQVNEYLQKLTEVEEKLSEFRSNNPDARSGLEAEVSNRITRLTTDVESTQLELRETEIRQNSLQQQLSGEAAITISQSKEGQYRAKIADLQASLETLRLDYKDTYPDIVRLKHQIADLKQSMINERLKRQEAKNKAQITGTHYIDEAIILNPLYQQLRSDASSTQTHIATLNARIVEMKKMLENEYERAKRIHGGEAKLSKLTRNYEVNQDIYQDLLKRMERARVSRNLDKENQGLTFKIQEPSKIPLIPTGLRFIHFAAAGLLLGITIPFALIYALLELDPRIRFSKELTKDLGIPVLAEIEVYRNSKEEKAELFSLLLLSFGVVVVLAIYAYVGWLKFTGQV